MTGDGIFFVLVGPSGAGKNTLMRRVKEFTPDLSQVATMTTRDPRPGEKEGREHRFVSQERFQQAIRDNELVEWQRVHKRDQNSDYDLYGTPRDVVESHLASGHDLIADIEFLGAAKLQEAFPNHAVLIFVTPSNLQILADRIMQRGDITPGELAGRLNRARFEMTFAPECHYLVINDSREQAAQELHQLVSAEREQRHHPGNAPGNRAHPHRIDADLTALIHRGESLLLQHGEPPRLPLNGRGARLDELARERVDDLLGVPLQVIGPRDERFDYPAPSHVTAAGSPPHFTLNYYYRFLYPEANHPVPTGCEWAPLGSVNLPQLLSELVTP